MLSEYEQHRLREGMHTVRRLSTHDWRFYFTYLLGRPVSIAETERFLQAEALGQAVGQGVA